MNGYNSQGQIITPASLTTASAIFAGGYHSGAIQTDGVVVLWGGDDQNNVPANVNNAVKVVTSQINSLALKSDGTLINWESADASPLAPNSPKYYKIYQNSVLINFFDSSIMTYSKDGLIPNTLYKFYVEGIVFGSNEEHIVILTSNVLDITTLVVLVAPDNLVISNATAISFTLTWDAVVDATTYQVYKNNIAYDIPQVGTSSVIDNLMPNTAYNMTVRALNGDSESVQSSVLVVTTAVVSPPTNLVSSNITDTSFTVSWTPAIGATTYQVYKNNIAYDVPQVGTSSVIDNLMPNTAYNMTVVAIYPDARTAESDILSVTTLVAASVLTPPTGLASSNITNTGFTLTWNPVAGATGYQVVYANGTFLGVSTQVTTQSFTGLASNTSYYVAVTTLNEEGQSAQSNTLAVKTDYAPATLVAPANLVSSNITSSSFTLTWDVVTDAVVYRVFKDSVEYGSDQSGTSMNIIGLNAELSYSMTVVAINGSILSPVSSSLVVTTLEESLAVPTNLVLSNITSSSFTLTWDVVTGATGYQVYKDGVVYGSEQSGTMITVNSLEANTSYNMTVIASNNTETSLFSAPLIVTTLATNSLYVRGRKLKLLMPVPNATKVERFPTLTWDISTESPVNLSLMFQSSISVILSWDSVVDAVSYNLYFDGVLLDNVLSTSLNYLFSDLAVGVCSDLGVSAINANGVESLITYIVAYSDPAL